MLVVGRAYRDIGEHERAYLVWRAIVEASYLEDAQVGEVLRQRGKTLDAVAYLLDLWRDYPDTASIEADLFGLSQLLAVSAGKAITDPALRKELADAGVTRSELLLQAIRLDQVVPRRSRPRTRWPTRSAWRWSATSWSWRTTRPSSGSPAGYAELYPKSTFLDSFQYSEALGEFHLGHYDRAIEVAEKIAKATYKDANGVDQPSPNKWQATYILGQIYDARRQPAKAVEYYKLVADRFTDAAGAVKGADAQGPEAPRGLDRPPRREGRRSPAGGSALNRIAAEPPKVTDKPAVALDYRNIAEADVKVYPVDLMRLYLTRRNLDGDRRDRPGRDHAAGRDDGQARRRPGLRRQDPADRPAAGEGGGLPRDDPRREPATPRGSSWSARWSWRSWRRPTPAGSASRSATPRRRTRCRRSASR